MNRHNFAIELLRWWDIFKRDLPWKHTKDPYQIWISEIILQQTRVEQGTPYFAEFIKTFPDISALAKASEDEVLKLWEGLGYYSRARNLHYTAKYIHNNLAGIFPNSYLELIRLKGIGPYTAAAIASFAYDLPYAVVDGNVLRLISRIQGISDPIDQPKTHIQVLDFVSEAINHVNPASFNQALMDFGSMICTPKIPDCTNCIFNTYCVAYNQELVSLIPTKTKKAARKLRYFHYLDFRLNNNEETVIIQRSDSDIWKKLYEIPMIETDNGDVLDQESIIQKWENISGHKDISIQINIPKMGPTQILTHQKIHGYFYEVQVIKRLEKINPPYYLVNSKKVSNFAFPKIINEYIKTVNNT